MQFIGSFGFFGSSVFTHGIIGVYRIPKNMVTGLVLGNGERAYLSISVKRSYQNWLVKHLLIETQSIVFCLKDFFYNCQQIKHHVLQELGGTDAIVNTYICRVYIKVMEQTSLSLANFTGNINWASSPIANLKGTIRILIVLHAVSHSQLFHMCNCDVTSM